MSLRSKILIPIATVLLSLLAAELVALLILRNNPNRKIDLISPREAAPSAFEKPETFGRLPRFSSKPRPPIADYEVDYEFPWTAGQIWLPPAGRTFMIQYKNPKTGEVLREARYRTDSSARRLDPWREERKKTATRHIFAVGCSLTWGHAVNDDETFLARISERHPDLITYNAGVNGYSISEILARAMTTDVMSDISPPEGIGIYVVFEDHLHRFANSTSLVGSWRQKGLVMNETAEGVFAPVGPVGQVEPLWAAFSRLWVRSSLVQLLQLDFPIITSRTVDRFMREVKAYREIYWSKTRRSNPFVVVIFPFPGSTSLLREGLTRAEIPFLDYGKYDAEEFTQGPAFLPGDGHPSPELYRVFSIALERDLRNLFP